MNEVRASHVMGGEITWECQANGQYIFTLKVYRDCNGINLPTNNQIIEAHNYPNVGLKTDIAVSFQNVTDISPTCLGNPCSGGGGVGAIEEYVFVSNPITLNGIPPAVGWTFTWTNYARNAAIDNIVNANTYGLTLRATMFPYQNRNAFPCFDSSPDFFQEPSTVVCSNQPFTYNHSAYDQELDSLVYSWGRPLNGPGCTTPPCRIPGVFQTNVNPNQVPYDGAQGYSFNSPFPGPTLDPRNVPATLDPNTGEISFESYNAGEFVSVVRVQAYKCGDLVAEVYRDLQTVVQSGCGLNEAPIIPPVFANGTFSDTVKAGDFVTFDFNVFDTIRAGNSLNDSIFIYATGQQFGTNFTDSTSGCTNPPCATFSQALPDSALGTYNSTFNWQTSCDHIAQSDPFCTSSQSTYLFVIRAFDNFCPASGLTVATVSITVLADSLMDHPDIHCADVQANGDVIIDWNQTADPDSSFQQWMIYSSTNRGGPYTLVDSILDYNITTYTHNNAGANDQSIHYIVRAKSGCHRDWLSLPTDTISSMYIDPTFNGNCVDVSWNTLDNPLPDGSATNYEVYREFPVGSGFSLYKTTADTFFCDTFDVCTDTVTYRIQIANNGNGCWGSSSNINGVRFQYAQPSVNATVDFDASCFGINDGTAYATPSGGTTPYTYLWSDNQTQDTARNLSAGTYQLTLTDSKGCIDTTSVTITEPDSIISSIGSSIDVSCFGGNDAYAVAGGLGGTTPYTYLWSDNQVQDTARNLSAGQYRVTITDAQGCSDTVSVQINEPTPLQTSISTSANVSCNGLSDGSATVSANGGTSPYTYLWSDNQTTANAANLSAGNYSVTITDANACTSVESITLTEPNVLSSTLATQIDVSCNGFSDGSAKVTMSGGTTPYTYLWSDNQTADSAINLSAGNYSVTITDANGCTESANVTISEPAILTTSTQLINHLSCYQANDGAAYATANGGTTPYTYNWSNNTANDSISSIAAGTYVVTVTDAQNCTATDTIQITEPDSLQSSITDTVFVSCNGGNDGSAEVTALGGTTPYTYTWSDNQTTQTASNLSQGTYQVTVNDANGCTTISTVTITEPPLLTASISATTNVSCNGLSNGRAVVTANGGTLPYTYLWNDNQQLDTASNLSAGSYSVTVTDNKGCTATANIIINEPAQLTVSNASSTDVSCNGGNDGQATVNISGGTTPYSYLWSDNQTTATANNLTEGTYTVTVTDDLGCSIIDTIIINEPPALSSTISSTSNISCNGAADGSVTVSATGGTQPYTYNWNNNATTANIQNLNPGTYVVTITDANSCTKLDSVSISQPNALTSSISNSTNVSCFGLADGTAAVTISGGTTPYTYFWSNNATANNIQNLSAGTYRVTVTDNNNCRLTDSVTITQPNQLTSTLNGQDISCFGRSDGTISASVNGGTAPYSYDWSTNSSNSTIGNLAEGTYTVTITDINGCEDTNSFQINEPNELTLSVTADDTVCINVPKQLVAVAQGGTGAYTYTWSNNLGNSPNQSVTPQQNTTYSVSVTDANNCPQKVESVSLTVRDIASNNLSVISSNNICVGDSATISVSFDGNLGPYFYNWNQALNGISDQRVSPASTTTYQLTITDICNNSISDSAVVQVSEPPQINLNDTLVQGCEDLSVSFSNRTPNGYTYEWIFGNGESSTEAEPTHIYTEPGLYNVGLKVTTPQGCESISNANYQVRVLNAPEAEIFANPTSTDIKNPIIDFYGNFGDAVSWQWFFGDGRDSSNVNNITYTYADTGTYRVKLFETGSNGCIDSAFVNIRINPNYDIKIPNVFIPNTNGSNGGRYNSKNPDNSVFFPYMEYVEDYHLMIFNRWGELVFESKDINIGWDGYYKNELAQADVYVYKIEVQFINGKRETKVGDLTLLR